MTDKTDYRPAILIILVLGASLALGSQIQPAPTTVEGQLGSLLTITYEDGTSRQEYSDEFKSWFIAFQAVYDGDKPISMIGFTALMKILFPTDLPQTNTGDISFTYQISMGGTLQQSDTVQSQGQFIHNNAISMDLTILDVDTILQWSNSSGVHPLEFAIVDCQVAFPQLETTLDFPRHSMILNVDIAQDVTAPQPPTQPPTEPPPEPPPGPTYILYEGFEGTFPPTGWTFSTTAGESMEKCSDQKHTGSYSAHFICDGLPTTGADMCYMNAWLSTPLTSAYYACELRFDTLPDAGQDYIVPMDIRAKSEQPGALAWVIVKETGLVRLYYRDSDLNGTRYGTTTATITPGVWHHIEVYVKVGNPGTVTIWVDGTQALTDSIRNDEWGGITLVQYGERWSKAHAHNVWIDEIKIDDVKIGP